jgi:GMP synthase (glutamine-hydrolysing)
MAHAWGGRVERKEGGPELGIYDIEVVVDDPLFDGFGPSFPAFESHWDHVVDRPPDSTLLGRGDGSELQVLSYGPRSRSVQFHPEYDADLVRSAVLRHGGWLDPPRPEWIQAQHDAVRELPHQRRIITNFVKHFTDVR